MNLDNGKGLVRKGVMNCDKKCELNSASPTLGGIGTHSENFKICVSFG